MVGILESMPGVSWNEYRSAPFKGMSGIVQYDGSAAFKNKKGFVHFEVPVDRNAGADHYLLSSHGEIAGACGRAEFDEDVAVVTEMNEVFAFGSAEYRSLWRSGLSGDGLR